MKRFLLALSLVMMVIAVSISITAQESTTQIPLDHPYAAFLESRAYGASMGATAELNKMEWVVIDPINNKYYITMSDITGAMTDGEGEISVDENRCGIVYEGDLDAEYNLSELRPLIVGGPFTDGAENPCDVNNISNPDGLAIDGRGRLWIAEDSGRHLNNVVWVYDPADGSLKRFAYVPLGAEVTGVYISPAGHLFFSNQHPDETNVAPFNMGTVVAVTGFNANTDDFESLEAPTGDAQLTVAVAAGDIQALAVSGDAIPANDAQVVGGIYTVAGEMMFVSNDPDGIMWLPANEEETEGTLYVNYEGTPGGVMELALSYSEMAWTVNSGEMVDFSSVYGTWVNCGSSVTPWNTGLTSEEYEPFAGDLVNVEGMTTYLGTQANPYDYGWTVELAPSEEGTIITKQYAMGRRSHENAWVAPDNKTVYFGDDGANVMFFKFVATTEGDLSAGTLYAAKITQSGGTGNEHVLGFEWIELGTATNDEIGASIREMNF
jgi:secreted PhoX family phosphatase